MKKAFVITTDGDTYLTEMGDNSLKTLQELVGGYITGVHQAGWFYKDAIIGYANDEGLLEGLPYNLSASLLFGQHLVGNVVVMGALNENGRNDGDDHELPDFVVEDIRTFIGQQMDALIEREKGWVVL